MSRAHVASLGAFLLCGLGGLALFFTLRPFVLGVVAFAAAAVAGIILAARLFDRLATYDEKRRDLEGRVRNSDL